MIINRLTFWRCFSILIVIAGLTGLHTTIVFSDPSTLVDDSDIIGGETWKVWTEYTDTSEDIMYCRNIDGRDTPAEMVNRLNSVPDMDAAIAGCDACPKPREKVWTAWERYDVSSIGNDTDIIMSTRSIGTGWGSEIFPHYDNDYDDFNPDILGDSNGHIWVAWVVYLSEDNEYQLRYTYYDGVGDSDSGWYADIVAHVGDLGDNSEPQLIELSSGAVKVKWKNTEGMKFEKILPNPED
jgi:hypothetical protein